MRRKILATAIFLSIFLLMVFWVCHTAHHHGGNPNIVFYAAVLVVIWTGMFWLREVTR